MSPRKTRVKRKEELDYVLNTIFDLEETHPMQLILRGPGRVTSVESLLGMTNENLMSFKYIKEEEKEPLSLNGAEISLIRVLKGYIWHLNMTSTSIGNDFMKIDPLDFDNFRISDKWTQMVELDPNIAFTTNFGPAMPTNAASASANSTSKTAAAFKKGIKRDPSLFLVLKEDNQWDSWKRNLIATARAQDVGEVLDPLYTPSTEEENELFDEKKKFMYSVFDRVLKTDKGKSFVRQHEDDYNAQGVFSKLKEYYTNSTKAALEASKLLSYITSIRIDSPSWKGSSEAFILHWQDQVRLYESIVDTKDYFSDTQKRTILENAVSPLKALRAVKDQADQFKTQLNKTLDYEEYSSLVTSAASNYDTSFKMKTSKPSRKVYYHQNEFASDSEDSTNYNIDLPASTILANMTSRNNYNDKSHFMPFEKWKQLTPEAKEIWDILPNDMKSVILFSTKKSDFNSPKFKSYKDSKKSDSRKITKAMVHSLLSTISDDDSISNNKSSNESSDENFVTNDLLVNSATYKNVSPSDIRKLLSVPEKKKPPDKSKSDNKILANKTSTSQVDNTKDEIVINGKVYRSVNKAITYFLSKHDRTHSQSLIDRGANGGVAGEDVRVINKASDRKICIRGIDNHEITDVPSVTAGGVTQSTKGEVIIILH